MAFNTSRQSIDRIRQRYAASWDVKDLPRSGRPRATNRAEDRLITNITLRNRFTNAPGRFNNNQVLEAYPSLFKPSRTDSMLLGSSPVFLLRSPVFLRCTEQLAFSLLVITSGGIGNSGEQSRSQMRAGFVFDTLTGGYVSGIETGNVTQKSTCSHSMRIIMIMEEASWSGQVWGRTGAPTSLLFQEYWPDNATSTRSYVLMWCLSCAQWATMASSKMTTQGRIWQELKTDFCKLTMWGVKNGQRCRRTQAV